MADGYEFPLLVELEESSTPRLKNKLVKYFQSKKSLGGDCEVDYETGSSTALLRFRSEEDQRRVLRKDSHQINLETGLLKMTVRLPSEQETTQEDSSDGGSKKSDVSETSKPPAADKCTPVKEAQAEAKGRDDAADDATDEELCSTSAVLENIPDSVNQEFLEMLVENVIKDLTSTTASLFTLEVIPEGSCGVVTFQNGKDNSDFIAKCPKNRMFTRMKLSVRPLEVTEQVVAEGIPNCNVDVVELHFENEGGDVEDVRINEAEQSAIITFKNPQDARTVLNKKHKIKKEEFKVYPFYKSLGVALYGKDKPSPKLPAAISEPIDGAVLTYLKNNKAAAETVRCDLAKHFCNITLDQSTVRLSPTPSILKEKDAKTIIKEWANTVKSAFAQAMSKFKAFKLSLESEVWKESEEKIKQTLQNEDVVVVPDKASGVLSVAGLVTDVNRLEKPLTEVLNKAQQIVRREKLSKTQDIKVSPPLFHILSQDGLKDKLKQVCPELKVSYDKLNSVVKVTGFVDEIIDASKVINDAMFTLKRQNLEVDTYLFDTMKDEQQEDLTDALLTAYAINAALEISAHSIQLIAVSDREILDAQDHLKQLLISQHIDVEDNKVLKMPEWQHLVSQLESANSESGKKSRIYTTPQKVVVSGHKDSVTKVSNELEDFLTQNSHDEENIAVEADLIIEYLQSQTTLPSLLKQLESNVDVSYVKEAIILSGPRAAVKQYKNIVEDIVYSVFFEPFKVSKPGANKLFIKKETMYVPLIKNETGCLVQLVEEQDDFVHVQKSVYQIQTADGVEIAVFKADMCTYPVDAVINPSNEDLNHNGGLAGALLKAAGPQLQSECNKIITTKGKLKPGNCVITGAGGQLCCKNIIHAVGPKFEKAKSMKAEAQLKRTVKESLELAERQGCLSVALPAISRGLGFPLNLCVFTIVRAVKEYCDEKADDNTLKKIHLVDNKDTVVKVMEDAIKQEFGNQGVHPPQPASLPKLIKPPQVKLPVLSQSLCRVQTKEGLEIILKKGQIEAAKTEVIVNTVFDDLALNRGAVSNAILAAAGPKLQQLVTDQNPKGTHGEVIVTDGCKLKSKKVFHVVAPSWDKGQGTAEKTLSGIFKECLDMAEKTNLASISFPAIGTGNLSFPKDLVVSLMLDKILDFSSQTPPKHLKKVAIVLYPKDAQTIQAFSDEFIKRFPNASGSLTSTSSSQSTAGAFSKVTSSPGMHETKMGNVTVQVVSGDITKETTDVIVNSSNEDFSLQSGVSKAILDAAGLAVREECQFLGSQPNSGMIMTQPGNLKSKKILHLVGQTDPVKINTSVKEALQLCVKNSHTSISFPAIGTGQGNVQAKQVADSMLDGVIDVMSQNASSALTLIRIVIFQQHMLSDFQTSMQQREAPDPKDTAGIIGKAFQKIKAFFVSEHPEEPKKKEDVIIETVKPKSADFHICGASQANVNAAKKRISNLISDDITIAHITDNDILNFSAADLQHIIDIQKNMSVSISTENKNSQVSVIIEGLSKDVLKAHGEIDNMLRKVRSGQEMKKKWELASAVADWQYQSQGLQFQSFDVMTNYLLEQALEKELPNVSVTIKGQVYTVTMPKGPATDSKGNSLQIKRIDKFKDTDIPEDWDAMPPGTTCLCVEIQSGTEEYAEVLKLFQATCNRPVTKIKRIQNPGLWKGLEIKKSELETRNGHQNNERRLFHGTCESTIPIINEQGFNRSYAGKNAACYGNGSYFAVKASYSAQDTYSKPNQNKEKFMYLCRVLTGDFTLGQQHLIAPPSKGTNSVYLYDSVVDNASNPSMFVVFHDIQAYPEYLITFQ
ncbi:poly(ADP-ribose) polymerase family member 14-related sequence 1 [Kryptolebias marmoratus]|uniref:Poly [ADP-ribose] polymerase n=1 Tax=Kryptolebias marmoratus TaxID=37003 RepID=A0A3Q3BL27_KRYMA|nr:poly(ADP-ribose) polymerase family member 14-related sequence 1 [Kryptolebias marmoratus]